MRSQKSVQLISSSLYKLTRNIMETSLTKFRNKLIRNGDIQPKVLFDNVGDTYSLNENLACEYSLLDFDAKPEDRIYLFKSGWNSLKDYEVFEWAVYGKGRENLAVIFKRHALPQDPNEFYQFCYVTDGSTLCGASKIFQFSNISLTSMVFIPSPGNSLTSFPEQSYFESHSNLQQTQILLKSGESSLERKLQDVRKQEVCCTTVQTQEEQINIYKNEIKDLKSLIQELITSQAAANKLLDDLKNTMIDMKNEYKNLHCDMKSLEDKCQKHMDKQSNCVEIKNANAISSKQTDLDSLLEIENLPPFPKLEFPFMNTNNEDVNNK